MTLKELRNHFRFLKIKGVYYMYHLTQKGKWCVNSYMGSFVSNGNGKYTFENFKSTSSINKFLTYQQEWFDSLEYHSDCYEACIIPSALDERKLMHDLDSLENCERKYTSGYNNVCGLRVTFNGKTFFGEMGTLTINIVYLDNREPITDWKVIIYYPNGSWYQMDCNNHKQVVETIKWLIKIYLLQTTAYNYMHFTNPIDNNLVSSDITLEIPTGAFSTKKVDMKQTLIEQMEKTLENLKNS